MNTVYKIIFFTSCLCFYNLSSAKTLITYADANSSPAVYIDINKRGDSIGDQWIFDQPLLDENGNAIGNNSGFCLRTKVNSSSQCQWTLTIKKSTIQVAGREFDKGASLIAIVGGTGVYKGITGELHTIKQPDGTFKQTLTYQLPQPKLNTQDLISNVRPNGHYSCIECHGKTGIPPITDKYDKQSPILAAQDEEYLISQMLMFKSGQRTTKEMDDIFKDYTFKEIRAIAQYFSNQKHQKSTNLNPTIDSLKHSIQEDKSWFKKGKTLYLKGDQNRNITACATCHGNAGKGKPKLNAPRITNQYARYVRMTLLAYKNGHRTTDNNLDHVMQKTAKNLNVNDIKYLGAYIQSM
jgi:cytochrome c553